MSHSWNSTPTNNAENLDKIAKKAVPNLHLYIERYKSQFKPELGMRRTRVAIPGSGILNIPPLQAETETEENKKKGLWPRIAEGESFINDKDRLPPWQFSSHLHGTQIANIISAIDPNCDIYVAKITEGRDGMKSDIAVKVCGVVLDVHAANFSVSMSI